MRFGLALGRTAKAAVATREARCNQCGELLALLVVEHRLVPDHRALVLALVEDVEHAGIRGDVGGRGKWLMEGDVALAVHHHHAVEIHLAGPRAPAATDAKVGTTFSWRGVATASLTKASSFSSIGS